MAFCRIPPVTGSDFVGVDYGGFALSSGDFLYEIMGRRYGLWTMDYGGFAPYAPSYFLSVAKESNQRMPPPDFVTSNLRRLSAKSPQLALRAQTHGLS